MEAHLTIFAGNSQLSGHRSQASGEMDGARGSDPPCRVCCELDSKQLCISPSWCTQGTRATGRISLSQTPPTLTERITPDPWQVSPRSAMRQLSSTGSPLLSQFGTLR